MRKFLALVVLVVLLACYIGAEERRVYPVSAVVVDVDVDVIVAEDGFGNLWSFYGCGWDRGRLVSMIVESPTGAVVEDEILDIRDAGWL